MYITHAIWYDIIVVLLYVWYDCGVFTLWLCYIMVPHMSQSTASAIGILRVLMCLAFVGISHEFYVDSYALYE